MYAEPNKVDIIKGMFIPYCPNCTSDALDQGLGLVGAIIMPHNLYLHSGLVLVSHGHTTVLCCGKNTGRCLPFLLPSRVVLYLEVVVMKFRRESSTTTLNHV